MSILVSKLTICSQEKSMIVFVEHSVMEDTMLSSNSGFMEIREKLNSFQDGKDDLTDKIDFIICLGGDGTLLYASLLFQVISKLVFHL
jgi:NAD+ kinase